MTARGLVHPEFIVETDWLARHLDDPRVGVVDATTHLAPRADNVLYDVKSGREDFERSHIPGAQFADIDNELSDREASTHFMLPSAAQFAEGMCRMGIGAETFVVAYSTANHWWATRLWWMLRVFGHDKAAVLNGGFQKWQREDRPTQSGAALPRARTAFAARPRPQLVADRAAVLAAIGANASCTINALRPEQHAGTGGTKYGRCGHIAGSVNVPAVQVVDQNNEFKNAGELRRMLGDALNTPRVITYCGGGIAASSIAMLLMMLGHPNVQLYDASLSEWAADASLPMETS